MPSTVGVVSGVSSCVGLDASSGHVTFSL